MKYGRYEYERTYLLKSDCLKNRKINKTKKIRDKYIIGTDLRLRKVIEKNEIVYKLTQKQKLTPPRQGVLKINTLYLSKLEFDKINILQGYEIEKERHIIEINQMIIGIDRIILNKENLLIAEVEFDSELEMNRFLMPLFNIREITGEKEYSGFEIAKEYSKYK